MFVRILSCFVDVTYHYPHRNNFSSVYFYYSCAGTLSLPSSYNTSQTNNVHTHKNIQTYDTVCIYKTLVYGQKKWFVCCGITCHSLLSWNNILKWTKLWKWRITDGLRSLTLLRCVCSPLLRLQASKRRRSLQRTRPPPPPVPLWPPDIRIKSTPQRLRATVVSRRTPPVKPNRGRERRYRNNHTYLLYSLQQIRVYIT